MTSSVNYSWSLIKPEQLFGYLEEDFEEFKKDALSVRKAFHCILTCWHLTDWVHKYYESNKQLGLGDFRTTLYQDCPELKTMHDLITRFKHYEVSRPKEDIEDTTEYNGDFSRDFSSDFDISCLKVKINDSEICIEQLVEKVIEFWKDYLAEINVGK